VRWRNYGTAELTCLRRTDRLEHGRDLQHLSCSTSSHLCQAASGKKSAALSASPMLEERAPGRFMLFRPLTNAENLPITALVRADRNHNQTLRTSPANNPPSAYGAGIAIFGASDPFVAHPGLAPWNPNIASGLPNGQFSQNWWTPLLLSRISPIDVGRLRSHIIVPLLHSLRCSLGHLPLSNWRNYSITD
jgi:hypothetical protein